MAADSDSAADVTDGPIQVITPVAGDSLGNKTMTDAVESVRGLQPVKGRLTRCTGLHCVLQATPMDITFMVPLGDVSPTLTGDVALDGTGFTISHQVYDASVPPVAPAGGDWFGVKNKTTGRTYFFRIASVSGLVWTITATSGVGDANGTGAPIEFPAGSRVWFFGTTTDHPNRNWRMMASANNVLPLVLATTPKANQPILAHIPNTTAKALQFAITGDNPRV